MTLEDCIFCTIDKHPDFTPDKILKAYFNNYLSSGKVNLKAFSYQVGNYYPRNEIYNMKPEGVINELEQKTGLFLSNVELNKLIQAYCNKLGKKRDYQMDYITMNFNNMDELKSFLDNLNKYDEDALRDLLYTSYLYNPSVRSLIEKANKDFNYKHSVLLNDDIYTKVENFLKYINNYYDNSEYQDKKDEMQCVDSIFSLNLNENQKQQILSDLFYGNNNLFSDVLPDDLSKQNVIIALIKNAILTDLVFTNVRDRNKNEYILLEKITDKEEVLYNVLNIKNKLLNVNSNDVFANVSAAELSNNISNLSYDDVLFLSYLYLKVRNTDEKKMILKNARNVLYDVNDINKVAFENTSHMLDVLDSKEFIEALNNGYHI